MHFLFIDESGTIPPHEKHKPEDKFVLGGVIISEDTWFKINSDLATVKKDYHIDGEIKWRFFHKHRDKQNTLSHLEKTALEQLRLDIYSLITKYKSIKIITVVADVPRCYEKKHVCNDDDLYWFAYKKLIERFQYYLQDLSREAGMKMNGVAVCDHRERKQDKRLQDMHFKMTYGDMNYKSELNNIVEGLFIVPSHYSTGIQLADMVAGAVYRLYSKGDRTYYELIKPSIRKSPAGDVGGYGIVRFE
jgi:hypothetical protein